MKKIKQLLFTDLLNIKNDQELDKRVILINDPRWEKTVEKFNISSCFGIDCETYGAGIFDALYFRTAYIRLISIAISKTECLIIDLGGWQDDRKEKIEQHREILEILGQKLFDNKCLKLGVNLKFDIVMLMAEFGFRVRQVRDLMITSQVLWAGLGVEKASAGENRADRCKISHGMKGVAQRVGVDNLEEFPLDKTNQTSDWGWILNNSQLNYSAMDSLILFPIYERIRPLIKKAGNSYSIMAENDCVPVFAEMEYYGVPVDLNEIERQLALYKKAQEEEIQPFINSFPECNWQSNEQVLEALNTKYNFNLKSVGAEVITALNLPETEALIKARSMNTSISYLEGARDKAFSYKENEHLSVRSQFRQIAAAGTGRSSCNGKIGRGSKKLDIGVQLQNPPSKPPRKDLPNLLQIFAAPEGYSYGVFDLSAAHARIATELSQAKMLLKIYNEDYDGHSIFAAFIADQGFKEFERLRKEKIETTSFHKDYFEAQEKKSWTPDDIKKYKKYPAKLNTDVVDQFFGNKDFQNLIYQSDTPEESTWKFLKRLDPKDYKHLDSTEFKRYIYLKSLAGKTRFLAKTALYSSLNGSTAGRFLLAALGQGFDWFTIEIAKNCIKYFGDLYPELVSFIRSNNKKVNSTNFTFANFRDFNGSPIEGQWGLNRTLTGRTVYFKKYPCRAEWKKGQFEVSYTDNISSNWLMAEADIMKRWGADCINLFDKNPEWKAQIVVNKHDQWDFICLTEFVEPVANGVYSILQTVMGAWIKSIPIDESGLDPVSCFGKNSYEVK